MSAEVAVIDQAVDIARRTGAPVYVVHLSSAAALDWCRQARDAGQGWPRFVTRRGQVVLADGECTAEPGQGQWLPRDRTSPPAA